MPTLREKPTLDEFQKYVSELERERGFERQDILKKCLLLGEEVGELFKAVRNQERMSVDASAAISSVEEELADVLIMLCAVANRSDVSLERAFRRKEERNKQRTWTREP